MNNIEELLNQIELLKQALLFYGDEKNYENEVRYEESSLIYVDNGSQARFALKKVQETLDQNQKLQDDYNKVIGETISAIENNPINLSDMITTVKNIKDD